MPDQWRISNLQNSRTAAKKMPCVVIGMKADQIAVEYPEQYFIPHWQYAIYLTTRERCVQEEADFDVRFALADFFPEHGR